jgi:hypothetical protein
MVLQKVCVFIFIKEKRDGNNFWQQVNIGKNHFFSENYVKAKNDNSGRDCEVK